MERILKGTRRTVSATFYAPGGAAADPAPDSATVTVLNSSGTTLGTGSGTEGGTGRFTFDLTPTHTASLDRLTVRWTATVGGSSQTVETYYEIVGALYFSLDEARALYPLSDTSKYSNDAIIQARSSAEESLEQACGRAFVPRYRSQTFSGAGVTDALLDRIPVRTIRSVSVDGTALAGSDLTNVLVTGFGSVYNPLGFTRGNANVVIGYEYGDDYPPEEGRRAALLLAKDRLVQSSHDPRAESITTEAGTVRFATGTFGIPDVDSFVEYYRLPTVA